MSLGMVTLQALALALPFKASKGLKCQGQGLTSLSSSNAGLSVTLACNICQSVLSRITEQLRASLGRNKCLIHLTLFTGLLRLFAIDVIVVNIIIVIIIIAYVTIRVWS